MPQALPASRAWVSQRSRYISKKKPLFFLDKECRTENQGQWKGSARRFRDRLTLTASLKAKNILSGASITPVDGSHRYTPRVSTIQTPPTMPRGFPRPARSKDVELISTSLKRYVRSSPSVHASPLTFVRPRIHLIPTLYEAQPNQMLNMR